MLEGEFLINPPHVYDRKNTFIVLNNVEEIQYNNTYYYLGSAGSSM